MSQQADNLGIKLSPEGALVIVLPEGQELALPEGNAEAVLTRILLQRERNGRVGTDRAGTRFYMIHLARHQTDPAEHPQCAWCQEDLDAELVLRHPVTKVPMDARSMRSVSTGKISDELAKELGL